ncbi:codanin-1-like [Gigantopelta aegis]|uniref:codanin-1-like n=1 Tax=Gigantopelta aegis TaxID=1735272 RepID=UPI001B8899DF|nr:codanin-1-like [Gigantopelta aegis]
MAAIMKLIIQGEIVPHVVVSWLKKDTDGDMHQKLCEYNHIHEFIPYFLNYLRYQTLRLLQNGKAGNPSPVKTPTRDCERKEESRNRVKLFADSPTDSRSSTGCEHFIVSPEAAYNISNNNAAYNISNNNKYRLFNKTACHKLANNLKTEYSHCSSQTNSHKSPPSQLHDNPRTKQKLNFGEFLKTPELGKQKRKGLTGSSREGSPCESSPSPTGQTNRRSCNKKKGLFYLQNAGNNGNTAKQGSPVFSLQSFSDFPPVRSVKSPSSDAQSKIRNVSTSSANADTYGVTEAVKKPSRRIKPTFLMPGSKKLESSSFLNAPYEDPCNVSAPTKCGENGSSQGNLTFKERELLRHMKVNHQSADWPDVSASEDPTGKTPIKVSQTIPGVLVTTPSKAMLDRSLSGSEFVVANPDEVTNREILDILAELYSGCLQEHLFPNVIQELYFLTQLLTTQGREMTDMELETEEMVYFLTVHNAVYFAVSVLEKQINILQLLDKSTIKCLCDNPRVRAFSPTLQDKLQTVYNTISSVKKMSHFPQSPIGGVSFQADTDNRKNFPNDRSFHQFKKQRDLFYELIREWELKREVPGWSMVSSMANRIHSLVEFQTDLANHLHFARLFQSQLIAMCKGDKSIKMDGDDEQISLLNHLKKTNPEKFKKLQERFIQPFSTGGPCPPPRFQGYEEFFRDFIMAASSASFIQHLSNTLISKVTELNDQEFCHSTEKHEGSLIVEGEQDREMFEACLLTLRLVGKFLGFITFLPYLTTDLLPDVALTDYLALRNKNPRPLDITRHVKMAVASKRLVVTIPWVVQFLSMMDYAAPLTDYYRLLLSLLIHILKHSWKDIQDGRNCYGHFLIVVLIGWLLENTRMLGGLFFQEPPPNVLSLLPVNVEHNRSVDCHDLVSQDLVYTCCPYAGEMRSLLMEFAVGTNSRTTIRKITPIAADTGPTVTVSQKQLQCQLEENFFHNHHASMKRIVEFVADRTASNFIKRFRSTVLPKSLTEAKKRVEQVFLQSVQASPTNKTKDKLSHDLHGLAHALSEEVKASVVDRHEFCVKKISEIMPLLLPEEQPGAVVTVATSISCRQAEERIMLWFNMHITKSMYLRELTTESDRLMKAGLLNKPTVNTPELPAVDIITSHTETRQTGKPTPTTSTRENDPSEMCKNARPLSEIFSDLKYIVRNCLLAPDDPFDLEKANHLLTEIYAALSYRKDILTQTTKCVSQVLLDLILAIICDVHCDLDQPVIEHCVRLWRESLSGVTELHHVVSCRVCHSLVNSRNPQSSWKKYAQFVITLLEQDLLTPSSFQKKCLQLLQSTEAYTEQLGHCLCLIVEHFNRSGSKSVDMCEILEWIFHIQKVNSDLSEQIFSLIAANQNSTGNRTLIEKLTEKKEEGKIHRCDSSGDNNACLKWTELVGKKEPVIKTMDDIVVVSEKEKVT